MKKLDDIISRFEKEVEGAKSSNRQYWEDTPDDEIYNVDIHVWRKKGMGNSLQTIQGNKISIATALTSLFRTCIDKGILTKKELAEMVEISTKKWE